MFWRISEERLLFQRYPPRARTGLSMRWEDTLHRKDYTKSHFINESRAPQCLIGVDSLLYY